eukprot:11714355-Alexandrium_andersonii.AAC.1
MSASLVGSEMCIRDRLRSMKHVSLAARAGMYSCVSDVSGARVTVSTFGAVSYTHLTLPTICSV